MNTNNDCLPYLFYFIVLGKFSVNSKIIFLGPVWYVPLGDSAATNSNSSDEDEVLTRTDRRHSLLSQVEMDESIRHVDSDVESDEPEPFDLNRVSNNCKHLIKSNAYTYSHILSRSKIKF